MAREVGLMRSRDDWMFIEMLEAFAELVRADERNRTWTQEDWTEYECSIAAAEREACLNCYSPDDTATDWADKIRARGNT